MRDILNIKMGYIWDGGPVYTPTTTTHIPSHPPSPFSDIIPDWFESTPNILLYIQFFI